MNKQTEFRAALAKVRLPRDRRFVCARLAARSNTEAALVASPQLTRASATITATRALRRPAVVAALTAGLAFIEQTLAEAAGADATPPTRRK